MVFLVVLDVSRCRLNRVQTNEITLKSFNLDPGLPGMPGDIGEPGPPGKVKNMHLKN